MPSKLTQADFDAQIGADGLDEQLKLLEKLPEELTEELVKAMRKGNLAMKNDMKARVSQFTGSTARSIGSRVKINGPGNVTGITGPSDKGSNARAHVFRFMQDGAYWQNKNNRQPWIYDLLEWVEAKFGTTGEDSKRAAYGLAVSIKEKGTKGKAIARPVMDAKKGYVLGLLDAAVKKVLEKMKVSEWQ